MCTDVLSPDHVVKILLSFVHNLCAICSSTGALVLFYVNNRQTGSLQLLIAVGLATCKSGLDVKHESPLTKLQTADGPI